VEYFLEPNEFFVGDHVQFYLCLPERFTYKNFSIDKIKQNTSMTINDVSIIKIKDKNYIKVEFIPWEVGEISFPSLKEIGIYFELPDIHVCSILELDQTISLQEARPPLLLPGTTYLIYGYAIIFFIICFLVGSVAIWVRKKRISIINSFSKKYAMLIFYIAIKKLKYKLKKRKTSTSIEMRRNWSKKYETSFRLFLSSIYKNDGNWNSFTYTEIIEIVKGCNNEVLSLIKLIFNDLSLVRFSNVSDDGIEKRIIEYSFQLLKLYKKKN